ncbi:MAG: hypothetical protein CVT89_00360 [Candidatus Altiarchaeales archaeon HGW-Altiarchaeales-2]|nr:MAG: hypothetical protein CVT89_00360 [Candidatus Altiarchaeales archaeon HGW-Altiarchaeales-2]
MEFNLNNFKERVLTLDSIGLMYILVIGGLCHVLQIPEIVKGLLALPSLLIFYYLLGKSVLYGFEKLFNKESFLLTLNRLDIVSKFIFFWFFGFFAFAFLIVTLDLLGYYFLGARSILKYLPVLVLLFMFLYIWFKLKETSVYILKEQISKNINEICVLGITKKELSLFLLFTIGVVSIAKVFIPFPSLGPSFGIPSTSFLQSYRLIEAGFLGTVMGRLGDYGFLWLSMAFFNIKQLTLQWVGNYFLFFIHMFGMYLLAYVISKNKALSLLAAIFGTIFIGITAAYGHGMINGITGYNILTTTFPFVLFFIYKNFDFIKRKTMGGDLKLSFVTGILGICIFLISIAYSAFDISVSEIRPIFFAILLCFVVITMFYKRDILLAFLFIYFWATYLIHSSEWMLFSFILILYYLVLRIMEWKENGQYMDLYYISVGFVIFTFLFFIFQWVGIINFENNAVFSEYALKFQGYSTIDFSWKMDALEKWSNPILLILAGMGSLFVLLYNRYGDIPLVIGFAFVVFLYILPEGTTYRFSQGLAPFVGYLSALAIITIGGIFRHYSKSLVILLFVVVLVVTSLNPIYSHHKPYGGYPVGNPQLADYEYNAAEWMKYNIPENVGIVSDQFTTFTMVPLSNKILFFASGMGNLKYTSNITQEKNRIIIEDIFNAKNSETAYENTRKLKNMPVHWFGEAEYLSIKSKSDPSFKNLSFVIILTGRTEKWMDAAEYSLKNKGTFPNTINAYSLTGVRANSNYLKIFTNATYFTQLYNDSSNIYIFGVNPEPGVPFKDMNASG